MNPKSLRSVDPADLAELMWSMLADRARADVLTPA
jgi:hypothetical protein